MKKALIFVLVLLVAFTAYAAPKSINLLNGATATGAGPASIINDPGFKDHTVMMYYTDADSGISAVVVELQGCIIDEALSGCKWFTLAEHTFTSTQITNKQAMFHVVDKLVTSVRLNITTLTGSGAGDAVYGEYYGR